MVCVGIGRRAAAVLVAGTLGLAAATCAAGPISDRVAPGFCPASGDLADSPAGADRGLPPSARTAAVCSASPQVSFGISGAVVRLAGAPVVAAPATLLQPRLIADRLGGRPGDAALPALDETDLGRQATLAGAAIDARLDAHVQDSLRALAPLEDLAGDRYRPILAAVRETAGGPGLVDTSLRDVTVLFLLETVIQPRLEVDGSRTFSLFRLGRFSLERTGNPGGIRLTEHGSGLSWDLPRTPQPVHRLDHPSRSFVAEQHRSLPALAAYIVSRALASPWFYVCLLVSLAFGMSVRRWSRRARTGTILAGAHQSPRPLSR